MGFFNETIAPRKSASIAVDFEGSDWGGINGYTKPGGVLVTFGGKTLPLAQQAGLGQDVWWFSAYDSQSKPVNGDLVIKNPTSSPVVVAGWATIMTRRHLKVDISKHFPIKGEVFTVNLSLSEATADDDATVSISDQSGATTSVALTRTGVGQWTGSTSLPAQGEYEVRASTSGSRMRVATDEVTVGAGDVSVSPTFGERVEDTDRDGLIDNLILTPTITFATAGNYQVRGTLYDQAGVVVGTSDNGESAVAAGTQPVDLSFNGNYLYKSGRWGPYTLHVTVMHVLPATTTIEVDDVVLGQTALYDYLQFAHARISVDDKTLRSEAVDTNGDGYFEELRITGTVYLESEGQYTFTASLYVDSPLTAVATTATDRAMAAGSSTFEIVFSGADIAMAGRDGPYLLTTLDVYPTANPLQDSGPFWSQFETAPYKASQFH